jgi:hypothetical protein
MFEFVMMLSLWLACEAARKFFSSADSTSILMFAIFALVVFVVGVFTAYYGIELIRPDDDERTDRRRKMT